MDFFLVLNAFVTGYILLILVDLSSAPCANPMHVWPLGEGIGVLDILTNTSVGAVSNVKYVPGVPSIDSYNTMMFGGTHDSFADIVVPNYADQDDLSIALYAYFNDTVSGTIMEFRSDVFSGSQLTDIQQFRLYLDNGAIAMELKDFGIIPLNMVVNTHNWVFLELQRDRSRQHFELTDASTTTDLLIEDFFINLPGTIKLGADFNGNDPLNGAISCLSWTPDKTTCDADSYCSTANWSSLTTTTTSTTTTVPLTTTTDPPTTTTTPLTTTTTPPTTTTTPPTTTTTPPTTTTTPPTTTTTPPTTTTTPPTTTSAPPTTTIPPTTTTAAVLPTSTTTPSTTGTPPPTTGTPPPSTTTAPATTTTTPATTTATTATTSTTGIVGMMSLALTSSIKETCSHFQLTAMDATFGIPSDIIEVVNVERVSDCIRRCNMNLSCVSIAMKSISVLIRECKLSSVSSAGTVHDSGSMIFHLV